MAKKFFSILFFVLSGCLTVTFIVLLCSDYINSYPFGSAPFYLYVIERGVMFLIPAAVCLTVGIILLKKNNKKT